MFATNHISGSESNVRDPLLHFSYLVFSYGISVCQSDIVYARSGAEFHVATVWVLPCSLGNSHQIGFVSWCWAYFYCLDYSATVWWAEAATNTEASKIRRQPTLVLFVQKIRMYLEVMPMRSQICRKTPSCWIDILKKLYTPSLAARPQFILPLKQGELTQIPE